MFQRRFAILFFWFTGHNEESSYLNLTKGDTKEKVVKEKSTRLKLHWLDKFAPSSRDTCVWEVHFLIEKRQVFEVHVLSKA